MSDTHSHVGKSWPANGNLSNRNTAPTAQASIIGDRFGWIVALLIGIAALVLAIVAMYVVRDARDAVRIANEALQQSSRALERSNLTERESRLAQEDLMLLRNVMRANGITVETAGDHE